MTKTEKLLSGKFYHIYNCGINGSPVFLDNNDYKRFVNLYETFIDPIAETYAYCLMGNHFHFLLKLRSNIRYKYTIDDKSIDSEKFQIMKWVTVDVDEHKEQKLSEASVPGSVQSSSMIKIPKPHLHFSHFFNAYAKYFNTRHKHHGSLWERPFKRKMIDNKNQLRNTLLYIHNNPVHHGFCDHPVEYPWCSYLSCIAIKPTKLNRTSVMGWFNNKAEFIRMHNEKMEISRIEKWLGLTGDG